MSFDNKVMVYVQTIRSWHIIGRLGGCNSMNMQVQFLGVDASFKSLEPVIYYDTWMVMFMFMLLS